MLGIMRELDDVLSVKKFVEDYLTGFYHEKPVLIDWVRAVMKNSFWIRLSKWTK